jgi:hypothetical protein
MISKKCVLPQVNGDDHRTKSHEAGGAPTVSEKKLTILPFEDACSSRSNERACGDLNFILPILSSGE